MTRATGSFSLYMIVPGAKVSDTSPDRSKENVAEALQSSMGAKDGSPSAVSTKTSMAPLVGSFSQAGPRDTSLPMLNGAESRVAAGALMVKR